MPFRRLWAKYVEDRYGCTLHERECDLDLEPLTATQSEIELIKYEMVRDEGYRVEEPILAFKGRYGGFFIVDGHTRARVIWDRGGRSIRTILLTSPDAEVCADLVRNAEEAGGGRTLRIWEVPVVDRLGRDTPAWAAKRQELLDDWHKELAGRKEPL